MLYSEEEEGDLSLRLDVVLRTHKPLLTKLEQATFTREQLPAATMTNGSLGAAHSQQGFDLGGGSGGGGDARFAMEQQQQQQQVLQAGAGFVSTGGSSMGGVPGPVAAAGFEAGGGNEEEDGGEGNFWTYDEGNTVQEQQQQQQEYQELEQAHLRSQGTVTQRQEQQWQQRHEQALNLVAPPQQQQQDVVQEGDVQPPPPPPPDSTAGAAAADGNEADGVSAGAAWEGALSVQGAVLPQPAAGVGFVPMGGGGSGGALGLPPLPHHTVPIGSTGKVGSGPLNAPAGAWQTPTSPGESYTGSHLCGDSQGAAPGVRADTQLVLAVGGGSSSSGGGGGGGVHADGGGGKLPADISNVLTQLQQSGVLGGAAAAGGGGGVVTGAVEQQGSWGMEKQHYQQQQEQQHQYYQQQQEQVASVGNQQHGLFYQHQQQAVTYGGQHYGGGIDVQLQSSMTQQHQQDWVAAAAYQPSWQEQGIQFPVAQQQQSGSATAAAVQPPQVGGHGINGAAPMGGSGFSGPSSLGYSGHTVVHNGPVMNGSYAGSIEAAAVVSQAPAGIAGFTASALGPSTGATAVAGMQQHTSLLPPMAAALLPRALCQGLEAVVSNQPAFCDAVGDQAGLQALAQLSRGQQLWVVRHLQEQAATYAQGDEGQVEASYMQQLCAHAAQHNLVAM